MSTAELDTNPFSVTRRSPRQRRRAFVSAIKFLLLIAVCLGVTVSIGSYSRTWLVDRLTADFESLDPEQKQARLIQLAELGQPGIEPLVRSLADQDPQIARTAYELLQSAQNHWTVMRPGQRRSHHHTLIDAVTGIAVHLPDERTGWCTNLLQQTVLASVNRRDDESRRLYRLANDAIDMLAISERSGPSVLSDQPMDDGQPRRLVVRSRPLPITPPAQPALSDTSSSESSPDQTGSPRVVPASQRETRIVARSTDSTLARSGNEPNAAVYRSAKAIKLQPTAGPEAIVLRDIDEQNAGDASINQNHETSFQESSSEPVTDMVDSPLETLDDHSVMAWLGSPHTTMRQRARQELLARGFGETEIAIATQIAVGDLPARLALIDAISRSDRIDPRPWLLMLLNDDHREVRLHAISVLATMKDAYIDQRLHRHLTDEPDTQVAARIRRVLQLR